VIGWETQPRVVVVSMHGEVGGTALETRPAPARVKGDSAPDEGNTSRRRPLHEEAAMAAPMEKDADERGHKRGSRFNANWAWGGKQCRSSHANACGGPRRRKGTEAGGGQAAVAKVQFEDYLRNWIATYAGQARPRGFSETNRPEIEGRSRPTRSPMGNWKMADLETGGPSAS